MPAKAATPTPVNRYLSEKDIKTLKGMYKRKDIDNILKTFLPHIYEPSKGYVEAVNDAFFGKLEPDTQTSRTGLSDADRERCIIALLASRGESLTLALHIYMALMERVLPEEIAHIILLAGVYAGADNFTNGLNTEVETLKVLQMQLTAQKRLTAQRQLTAPAPKKQGPHPLSAAAVFGALRDTLQPPRI